MRVLCRLQVLLVLYETSTVGEEKQQTGKGLQVHVRVVEA